MEIPAIREALNTTNHLANTTCELTVATPLLLSDWSRLALRVGHFFSVQFCKRHGLTRSSRATPPPVNLEPPQRVEGRVKVGVGPTYEADVDQNVFHEFIYKVMLHTRYRISPLEHDIAAVRVPGMFISYHIIVPQSAARYKYCTSDHQALISDAFIPVVQEQEQ